jgi:hypothetical protein
MTEINNKYLGRGKNANDINAEYIYIVEDLDVWFIDYIIGIAFRTPIDFADKINGLLYKSAAGSGGRSYRKFHDIKDLQDYLEQITGQEIVIESSVDPVTKEEYDSRIVWHTATNLNLNSEFKSEEENDDDNNNCP